MTFWLLIGLAGLALGFVGWRKWLTRPGLNLRIREAMDQNFTGVVRKRFDPSATMVFDYLFACETVEAAATLTPLLVALGYQVRSEQDPSEAPQFLIASVSTTVAQLDFSQARRSFDALTLPPGSEYVGLGTASYAAAGVQVP